MSYIGKEPQFTQYPSKFFNGDGTAMTVSLDYAPPNAAALLVFIDGVRQDTSAYTLSGTSLTFTGTVPSGTNNVQVVHLGLTQDVGVPTDDTISTAKLQDDSVTAAKLNATGTPSSSTFLRGDMAWTAVSDTSGFSSVQTFTSSGTWTRPTGITKVRVYVTGGGAGGRTLSGNFAGGGGGGTAIKLLDVSSISSATITIGSGGAAATDGGDSTWSDGTNTITGNGGDYPTSSYGDGGAGGSASGGDINHPGGYGSYFTTGPGGGSSYWGTYGHSNGYNGSAYTIGSTPNIPGNGGMGWYSSLGPTSGSDGFVYVEEYK